MKKLFYLFLITISSICFISCGDDSPTPEAHNSNSCGTEQCVCTHKDSTSNTCTACGMENCTMGCGANN